MSAMLHSLKAAGFTLTVDGDRLRVAPFHKLNAEQRAYLQTHKMELISELTAANDSDPNATYWAWVQADDNRLFNYFFPNA